MGRVLRSLGVAALIVLDEQKLDPGFQDQPMTDQDWSSELIVTSHHPPPATALPSVPPASVCGYSLPC